MNTVKSNKLRILPLKIGDMLNMVRPPVPKYCPIDTSRRYIGIPQHITVSRYGIRKAPAKKIEKITQ